MYAIFRIQIKPRIWCWSVAFSREGHVYYKGFYDVRRGGSKQALAAAIIWRDEKLLAIKPLTKRAFCQIRRKSNSSGFPGVQFIVPKNQPQGSWQARLKLPGGKTVAKAFAVHEYGKRGAFTLAKAAREYLLETIEEKPYLHHREAKKFAALQDAAQKTGDKAP